MSAPATPRHPLACCCARCTSGRLRRLGGSRVLNPEALRKGLDTLAGARNAIELASMTRTLVAMTDRRLQAELIQEHARQLAALKRWEVSLD